MDPISLLTRELTSRVGNVSTGLLYLFLAFQIVDQTLLPILVITFLFTSAKRLPTLVNVCCTWIVTGIIASLLLFAGKHVGPEPPKMLCLTQAALLDAVPPMNSAAALALMFQTYRSLRGNTKKKSRKTLTYALIIVPYFIFFCFATAAAFLATQHPETVTRARKGFYCSFKTKVFSKVFALCTTAMLLGTQGFVVAIGIFIFKNRRALRQSGSLDVQTVSRVIVFGSYIFLTLVLSVLSLAAPRSPIPDLFTAAGGTVLALSLGTQPDLYRVWFRRPLFTPPRVETAPSEMISIDIESLRKKSELDDGSVDDVHEYYKGTALSIGKLEREAV